MPRGFNAGAAGRKNKKAIAHWASLGVTRVDGRPLSGEGPAGILLPAGIDGPAFLVTKNFDALYSYNAAESYGLAIAVLSDRLRGPGRHPGRLAHRRSAAVAGRAPRPAGPPDQARLRCRRAGRQGRLQDPRRHQGGRAQPRHAGDRPARGKVLEALRRG